MPSRIAELRCEEVAEHRDARGHVPPGRDDEVHGCVGLTVVGQHAHQLPTRQRLGGLLQLTPTPPFEGPTLVFFNGLLAARYLVPLLMVVELVAGLALLANRFVPLALVVLAPIHLNIVLFHAFLEPAGLGVAFALLAAELTLVRAHWDVFAPLVEARPSAQAGAQVDGASMLRRAV